MSRGPMVGLVALVLVLVAAVAVFAVTRDSDDDTKAKANAAAPDTCGKIGAASLGQAAIGIGLDGGVGSCDDFGPTVTASDVDSPVALRISYLNESTETQQNVTLRLELPEELTPQADSSTLYDTAGVGASMETSFLLWQEDGLRLGSYQPDSSAVVLVYADVAGDFDASGCEQLRDPVMAYASAKGESEVSASLSVQVGSGCSAESTAS